MFDPTLPATNSEMKSAEMRDQYNGLRDLIVPEADPVFAASEAALLVPGARVAPVAFATALLSLLVLGGAAARAGGASLSRGAIRVAFWGALAMGLTAGVGRLFGANP